MSRSFRALLAMSGSCRQCRSAFRWKYVPVTANAALASPADTMAAKPSVQYRVHDQVLLSSDTRKDKRPCSVSRSIPHAKKTGATETPPTGTFPPATRSPASAARTAASPAGCRDHGDRSETTPPPRGPGRGTAGPALPPPGPRGTQQGQPRHVAGQPRCQTGRATGRSQGATWASPSITTALGPLPVGPNRTGNHDHPPSDSPSWT